MNLSIQKLQDRYIKANAELDLYGLKMADKLSTGLAKPKEIKIFNMMSALISFIGKRLDPPVSVLGARPSITLPIPSKLSDLNGDFSMGIENTSGRYVPILGLSNYNISSQYYTSNENYSQLFELMSLPQTIYNSFTASVEYYEKYSKSLKYIDENNVDRGNFSFAFNSNSLDRFTITFPETSDFNGQRIKVSNNDFAYSQIINGDDTSIFNISPISGGANKHSSGSYLSLETMQTYNKALEEIAIELNISY
jgi:hypothetical protein